MTKAKRTGTILILPNSVQINPMRSGEQPRFKSIEFDAFKNGAGPKSKGVEFDPFYLQKINLEIWPRQKRTEMD